VGKGAGRTAAIIVGALIGSQVGKDIGASIDRTDEAKAQAALNRNQPTTWVNPDTNAEITVNPERTFQREDSRYCREYTTEIVVAGRTEKGYGTACKEPDGSWDMQSG
jgi:surface antigen